MKHRIIILFIFISTLFTLGLVRVFYLQMIPHQILSKLQKSQYISKISLLPQRGKILDRKGEELASSTVSYSLYADPSLVSSPKKLSRKLSKLLGISFKEIFEKLTQDKKFVWIKRQLEPEAKEKISDLKERSLGFVEEGKRSFPNQNIASQILGFVGIEGNGLEGLERKYDAELRGEKVSVLSKRDARGRPLLVSGQIFETSNDGGTLETTLDKDLQYELERQLEEVYEEQGADKAMGVIMDPNTGEVLAMASYPTYDPTRGAKASPELRRNSVVSEIFEPGSTFKIITAAAALRTGRIHPNTRYFCENGKFKIGKRTIHEAENAHKFTDLTLAQIIEVSSNIGSTKVAFDVGEMDMKKMIFDFGFGNQTGIDFPGEAYGLLSKEKWNEHLLSNVSFGHGVGVTALQIANAYSAIANGGKLMKPYLVKRVVDSQNNPIQETSTQILRKVLTEKEASTLTLMLAGVTQEGGTGTLARVDGYPVAGKTGTAQKVNLGSGGYIKNAYLSSFAGFIPANQPKFTIYVVIDNPKKQYYGAQVAAPVFNKLASFAMRKSGFMPIILSEKSLPTIKVQNEEKKTVELPVEDDGRIPNYRGLTLREVSQKLKLAGAFEKAEIKFIGTGVAYNQWPSAGEPFKDNQKLKIYFQPPK